LNKHDINNFLNEAIRVSKLSAAGVLEIYNNFININIETKEDGSPLTLADNLSHAIITFGLSKSFPGIPIVSEEGESEKLAPKSDLYWLIDPLDGTKEFINGNGEFTINVALIFKGYPLLGVVTVPFSNTIYIGGKEIGAKKMVDNKIERIKIRKKNKDDPLKLIASRSHQNDDTREFIGKLNIQEVITYGSSLKFCKIADGEVDIYPRLAPTSEWDTAAAQAVLEGAGGVVVDLNGERLRYGKEKILNPYFIATSLKLKDLIKIIHATGK
jgi:3'(2'), 5'-bisphosphate nucleotidase